MWTDDGELKWTYPFASLVKTNNIFCDVEKDLIMQSTLVIIVTSYMLYYILSLNPMVQNEIK